MMSNNDIQQHMQSPETWKRVALIVLFGIIYIFAQYVVFALVGVQFLFKLLTGQPQPLVGKLCEDTSLFLYRTLRYVMWITDEIPYPITCDKPSAPADAAPEPTPTETS